MKTKTQIMRRSRRGSGLAVFASTCALAWGVTAQVQQAGPTLDLRMVPELTISGVVGSTNQIQYVNAFADTIHWIALTNLVLTNSPLVWYDTISPPCFQRYYRAVTVPPGFVWIPAGTFTMGSPDSDWDRDSDEGPQTVVTLTKGFFLCQHEVTQAEYLAVTGSNPSYFTGDPNRPVEQVSWYDATGYCAKLTEQERAAGRLPDGWAYRLPTEAEWEYACRAGTTTRLYYGDDPGYAQLGQYAWYSGNSSDGTKPVGQKLPNPWGLYDMAGNVWEWCLDWYGAYPGGSVTDPKGPTSGSYRVHRGGGWLHADRGCRSADRSSGPPGAPVSSVLGFRVVLAPIQPPGFVWIPPGTFTMGTLDSSQDRYANASPLTAVTLTKGFFMGQHEVTQAEYQSVIGSNPSHFTGDLNRPVEEVTWSDATNYCATLTAAERAAGRLPDGWAYRLPTEAEWEYACRAGTTTRFYYGDDPDYSQLGKYAWYSPNSENTTHPVGLKQPNGWGLYDVYGNVNEWCLDWFGAYPGGNVIDPLGPNSGSNRVIRGACYGNDGSYCRSAWRYGPPNIAFDHVGFRVVLAPIQPPGFVWIRPGTFTMGSPDSEPDRDSDEGPQTVVTLTKGFFLCQHEVTQAEYLAVTGSNPSYFTGDPNRPVEQVSWYDATNYCATLTVTEQAAGRLPAGYVYRLPTEAEWEYACRAGTTTGFYYGDAGYTQLGNYAWYYSNGGQTTHPVGQKPANPWGLYDMAGNVCEWCLDWYGAYPGGSVTDPKGPTSGSYRVVRGGGWSEGGQECRSAGRINRTPDALGSGYGFRVVLATSQP